MWSLHLHHGRHRPLKLFAMGLMIAVIFCKQHLSMSEAHSLQ